MLILAFDTATDVAASALVDDGEVLGERSSVAKTLLEDVDALLRQASASPKELDALVVGTGPGSFTGTRIGLAVARGLALGLGIEGAGVSTLDALAAGAEDGFPVVDARRGEVFVPGGVAMAPEDVPVGGRLCVGDGAVRYREVLEARERRSRPTMTRVMRRGQSFTRDSRRPSGRSSRSSRSTFAPGRGALAPVMLELELRRLELADLDAIERIERASYRTPWSRSMFASELAKPSSLSFGAVDETGALVGYLVLSRYVDAWHVMNVAVAPEKRRQGVASALLQRLLELRGMTRCAATRSRCGSRTSERSASTSGSASARRASGAATTPTTARTR